MKLYRTNYFYLFVLLFLFVIACRKYEVLPDNEQDPRMSGGGQTAFDQGSSAFDHSFTGLSGRDQLIHDRGDKQFDLPFVPAPSHVNPGIGPLYNNISCGSCHTSQGSGSPPFAGSAASFESFFLRLSLNSGTDEHGGPLPVPGFGGQLQNQVVYGTKEGDYDVTYTTQTFTYPDGNTAQLRTPIYTIYNTYIPFPANVAVSPRMAPSIFGLGLLENISDSSIIAMANQAQTDTTVIPGHPNYVWDLEKNKMSVGRFGHKCETPTLKQQIAFALNEDIGITTNMMPTENCYGQAQYYNDSLHPEMSDSTLNNLVFYIRTIQVPARRNVTDPTVMRGEQLFKQAKCVGCHRQTIVTDVNVAFPQVSGQTIHPYTDLLLHYLGNGLADNRVVYSAAGNEYRTCPLWGIGLTQVVTGQTSFLHDGRARTFEEAILWHGGEANYSQKFFVNLSKSDRDALIAFLNSL